MSVGGIEKPMKTTRVASLNACTAPSQISLSAPEKSLLHVGGIRKTRRLEARMSSYPPNTVSLSSPSAGAAQLTDPCSFRTRRESFDLAMLLFLEQSYSTESRFKP